MIVVVSDRERSDAFYRDVCGAELVEITEPPPTRRRYRFGDVQLDVRGPGAAPAPPATAPTLSLVWPGTAAEALAHLAAHGVPVETGPTPRTAAAGPAFAIGFRDPDGAPVEFLAYGPPAG